MAVEVTRGKLETQPSRDSNRSSEREGRTSILSWDLAEIDFRRKGPLELLLMVPVVRHRVVSRLLSLLYRGSSVMSNGDDTREVIFVPDSGLGSTWLDVP